MSFTQRISGLNLKLTLTVKLGRYEANLMIGQKLDYWSVSLRGHVTDGRTHFIPQNDVICSLVAVVSNNYYVNANPLPYMMVVIMHLKIYGKLAK